MTVLVALAFGAVLIGCDKKDHRPPTPAESESVQGCISDLDASDPQVRMEAIRRLGRFGSDAESAAQALVRIADSDREPPVLRQAADRALTRIGLSLEIDHLQTHPDPEIRKHYAGCLGQSHDVRKWRDRSVYMEMVIPALVWSVRNDPDARVRDNAVLGLGGLCEEPGAEEAGESIVPVLIKAMEDPDREVRISAVVGLGDYGKRAKAALPIFRKMRDHPDEEMRHQVRRGIRCIEGDMRED